MRWVRWANPSGVRLGGAGGGGDSGGGGEGVKESAHMFLWVCCIGGESGVRGRREAGEMERLGGAPLSI